LRKILGILSGLIAVALLFAPLVVLYDPSSARQMGYLGFFLTCYFGFGNVVLPLLVRTLDPILLTLIASFGFTIDEFFAWYAGKASENVQPRKRWHHRVHAFVERRGLAAVFTLGLVPLPSAVYTVSGFAAGHFGIPFPRFFLVNFTGKLIRTVVIVTVSLALTS